MHVLLKVAIIGSLASCTDELETETLQTQLQFAPPADVYGWSGKCKCSDGAVEQGSYATLALNGLDYHHAAPPGDLQTTTSYRCTSDANGMSTSGLKTVAYVFKSPTFSDFGRTLVKLRCTGTQYSDRTWSYRWVVTYASSEYSNTGKRESPCAGGDELRTMVAASEWINDLGGHMKSFKHDSKGLQCSSTSTGEFKNRISDGASGTTLGAHHWESRHRSVTHPNASGPLAKWHCKSLQDGKTHEVVRDLTPQTSETQKYESGEIYSTKDASKQWRYSCPDQDCSFMFPEDVERRTRLIDWVEGDCWAPDIAAAF